MDLLYRLLLFAYPRAFRREYAAEMRVLLGVQRARARRDDARFAVARFWLFALGDLVRNAVAERTRRWRRPTPLRSPGPRPGRFHSQRPGELMNTFFQEARHAARRLLASPGFSLTAISIIALGVGANSAMFSVVDAVLLRPLPFSEPERVVSVYQDSDGGQPSSSSFPAFRDMRDHTEVFEGAVAVMQFGATLIGDSGAQAISPEFVTSNYFDLLGFSPMLGRDFEPADELDGGEPVAIVSQSFWQSRFGSDPEILGTRLRINGAAVTVVGVGPFGYGGITPGFNADVWLSLSALRPLYGDYVATTLDRRDDHWFQVRARLAPGVSAAHAQGAMDALAARLATEYPELNRGRDITVYAHDQVRIHPDVDAGLLPLSAGLMALVGLVLIIACSNLANLLLVRATARARDVTVRLALGATRGRIVAHILAESLMLSLAGGAVGLLLAWWATRAFLAAELPVPLPGVLDLRVDLRVAAFTVMVSATTGVLVGLLPALKVSRSEVVSALREDVQPLSLRGGRITLRNAFVVGQIALSVVILTVAGMFIRSVGNSQRVDVGVDASRIAVIATDVSHAGYASADAPGTFENLRARIAALPGVDSAALAAQLPVRGGGGSSTMVVEGYTPPSGTDAVELDRFSVGPGYFRTMGVPLLHGRTFDLTDDSAAPRVVIVSEAMARAFWGRTDVVGERLRSQGGQTWMEIVGVVGDVKIDDLTEPPTPLFYFSTLQGMGSAAFVVARATGSPSDQLAAMRAQLQAVDPALPVTALGTLDAHLADSLALARLGTGLISGFGLLGLALAGIGLYAVVGFAIRRRTTELGIRMALGAHQADLVGMVLREVLGLVAVALAIGVGLALAVAPAVAGSLYQVPAVDPAALLGTALLLVVTALLASWFPARRAARIDPIEALRQE